VKSNARAVSARSFWRGRDGAAEYSSALALPEEDHRVAPRHL